MTIAGMKPIFTSGYPNCADSSANTRSHAWRSLAPPITRFCHRCHQRPGMLRIAKKRAPPAGAIARCSITPAFADWAEQENVHARAEVLPLASNHNYAHAFSSAAVLSRSINAASISPFKAFRFSGRFSVILAMPASCENSIKRRSPFRATWLEQVFPCGSALRATAPPPSSAWCNRKFIASRFGTSKRSTSPKHTPAKCSFTRSAVTSCTRIG